MLIDTGSDLDQNNNELQYAFTAHNRTYSPEEYKLLNKIDVLHADSQQEVRESDAQEGEC